MARRNGRKAFKTMRNKGQHQRRRSTRGGRLISKIKIKKEVITNEHAT